MSLPRNRLVEITRRKESLIARADRQRAAIRDNFRQLQEPIVVVDRGLEIARFLRAHPLLAAALVGGVMVFCRRGLVSLAGGALSAWRLWRSLSAWTA
jgi:hypothetical protein